MVPENIQMTWKDEYQIHTYETDAKGYLSLPKLCKFLQESASRHAEHLGFGYQSLMDHQLIWVLVAQYIEIKVLPHWKDIVQVQTRPSLKDRIYYYRDFQILDKNSENIAVSTTKWLPVDIKTRRPSREDMHQCHDWSHMERFCPKILNKLTPLKSSQCVGTFKVNYTDLDVNQHMNQARYIEWIWESLPMEFHQSHRIKDIEIHYHSEALYGNEVQLYMDRDLENTLDYSMHRIEDDKIICRVKTHWIK